MKVGGDVMFHGAILHGGVRLPGADITGDLACQGAQLHGTDTNGNALVGYRMKVGGTMFLDEGFVAVGTVRLTAGLRS